MSKKLLFVLFAVFQMALGFAQSNLWTKVSEEKLRGFEKFEKTMPSDYELYQLDYIALKNIVAAAPLQGAGQSNIIIAFPNAEGGFENFVVYYAPVMHPELAARYADIRTYVALSLDNPRKSLRFSTSMFGLEGMTLFGKGRVYIDSYTKDLNSYIVYKRESITVSRNFGCYNEEEMLSHEIESTQSILSTQAGDGVLRTYRLAMSCTQEYAAFHVNQAGVNLGTIMQKKAAVLAAMNKTMNRVNGIFEKDLAVTMQLIPTNDQIIYLSNDNFNNADANDLIDENQDVIDAVIGSANYDIGHVVSTGGGGLAQLASVCNNGSKAKGVTGSPSPVDDDFDVDYVAHEMGHQFGAQHTFNGNTGSCGGNNRSAGTAVEPGSGTTIMGYAGICGQANVQQHSDDYFHAVSIAQMVNTLNQTSCAVETELNNQAPVITPIPSYHIPKGTPFVLRAEAIDTDGDALTYCWEQTNANGTATPSPPTSFTASGPAFRSLPPTESTERYFPPFQNVLNGSLTASWQAVPSIARTLSFALTVRDYNEEMTAGQTARENTQVNVTNDMPFTVIAPSLAATWSINSTNTVSWAVGATAQAPISVANVNILLSTDGGETFTTIAANTPNDGTESITLPEGTEVSNNCRILVEAVDNVFYAVSISFIIDEAAAIDDFRADSFVVYPNPNRGNFKVKFNSTSSNDINISAYDMRGRQIYAKSFTNTGLFSGDINLEGAQAGVYLVTVQDGSRKEVKRVVVE